MEREHLEIELQELTKEKPEDPTSWHDDVDGMDEFFFGVHRSVSCFVGMSIQGFKN